MGIRKARKEDAQGIHIVSAELGYAEVSQETAAKRLDVLMESAADEIFVFEDGGQVKGWIHVFVAHRAASASFAEIGGLAVSSSFRRRGIGRGLVDHALSWAAELGLKTRVRCNTKRRETHEFYDSIGLERKKEQVVFEK